MTNSENPEAGETLDRLLDILLDRLLNEREARDANKAKNKNTKAVSGKKDRKEESDQMKPRPIMTRKGRNSRQQAQGPQVGGK